jgi:hypothetical protein
MKNTVFWNVTPCNLLEIYPFSEEPSASIYVESHRDTTTLITMFHPAHPPWLLCSSCCSDHNTDYLQYSCKCLRLTSLLFWEAWISPRCGTWWWHSSLEGPFATSASGTCNKNVPFVAGRYHSRISHTGLQDGEQTWRCQMISRIHHVHGPLEHKRLKLSYLNSKLIFTTRIYFQGYKGGDSASKLKPKQIIISRLSKRQDFIIKFVHVCITAPQKSHASNDKPFLTKCVHIFSVVLKDLCNIKYYYPITAHINCPTLNDTSVASNSHARQIGNTKTPQLMHTNLVSGTETWNAKMTKLTAQQ